MRIALAQINQFVGDIAGNERRILDAIDEGTRKGAQIIALPELAVTGYPPEDLLLKDSFVRANHDALERIASTTKEALVVVGFVQSTGGSMYNAAAICQHGEVLAVYRKHLLPNYGVFDEQRHFQPGRGHVLVDTPDGVLGVCVCEDAWAERGPVLRQGAAGAQVIVNINASPFHKGKLAERTAMLADRARAAGSSIVYVNMVGGQDELVFDGGSLVLDADGRLVAQLPQFEEHVSTVDVPLGERGESHHPSIRILEAELPRVNDEVPVHPAEALIEEEEVYRALCLSLRDYVSKNAFERVVIGLSGGIDSSLTATIAADALGPANVLAVAMPSRFSSAHSIEDARAVAGNLGKELVEIPIDQPFSAYVDAMASTFGPADAGLAEENLQARVRGNLLMAISNRYGHLVLATGNKSEMACGYTTLYGDMAGGFALLKDVFKTEVYALARYRNKSSPAIPERVLDKPPSAELRPDQKDSDSLPPYDVLDPILEAYVEGDTSIASLVAAGHDEDVVSRVVALVDAAEYKRRQAPPGPKVTTKAFGRDRRLPITNRWKEGSTTDAPARSLGPRR